MLIQKGEHDVLRCNIDLCRFTLPSRESMRGTDLLFFAESSGKRNRPTIPFNSVAGSWCSPYNPTPLNRLGIFM